ncbi:MAG: Eco57I restriction-modification methylase domain-containing protein [Ignavibacteriae bacterium]|nr:Eco57I restriction-modification methylase domain-containing protein [Ignavibacteriota bacterium]
MAIQRKLFNQLIKDFNFSELFIELGWDKVLITQKIKANDETYEIKSAAQKRSFVIFVCNSNHDNRIPNKDERKKIDKAVTKLFYEHLIIYIDKNKTQQLWQLSVQEPNKPIQYREFNYYIKNDPQQLFEKLNHLFFTLDDEDKIALVDVKSRVTEQFNQNAEKVTKAFYAEFKKHHAVFQSFIQGLENQMDIDWYTSLMLNRLMFVYFIQKKGFLDSNTNYLSDKLRTIKSKQGKDKFYKTFYKTFLLTLFHQGLGKPNHTPDFEKELGKIPYLNGGLFDVHKLEKDNDKLDIADKAFEKLFAFFDEYNWHLDIKPNTTGKDINPDVIGYIFEKYINDRATTGAYYTKEDITEYISKNTVIPYLFDKVKEKVKNAFTYDSSLWKMLKENPDRYIYDSVKKGINTNFNIKNNFNDKVTEDLPNFISIGIDTSKPNLLERRNRWNEKTDEELALPTEIWRETIERRKRYWELRAKIENDEIREINDFITYNLNIRQFAQDAVEQYEGSDFVNAFYKAITEITILDPTCGSGAFLFAALNILEPLYEACISRMREFVEVDNEKGNGKKHENFRKVLNDIEIHTNEKYYIFKSIILNNLYGVDIMNEAVEIAKLRLFLKLVAVVEPDERKENYGLEPLPDIDFNIRAGNTLVGYATENEIDSGSELDAFNEKEKEKVKNELLEKIEIAASSFKSYKEVQLESCKLDYIQFKKAKDNLELRLKELNEQLNDYLAKDYGIVKEKNKKKYSEWIQTHKPFHWFAEFYEIVHQNGGFDVIIGNPPYIENSKVFNIYKPKLSITIDAGNIYTLVLERGHSIVHKKSKHGWIIPISAVCTDRTTSFQNFIRSNYNRWIATYDIFPARLFTGAAQRLTILILTNNEKLFQQFVTKYYRWYENERNNLIDLVFYNRNLDFDEVGWLARINQYIGWDVLQKLKQKRLVNFLYKPKEKLIYVHRIINNFIKAIDFEPIFKKSNGIVTHSDDFKMLYTSSVHNAVIISILNSNLFYFYWRIHGDGFHCGFKDIEKFPVDISKIQKNEEKQLKLLSKILVKNLEKNSEIRIRDQKTTGKVELQTFFVGKSKTIIDEIDKVLAKHYSFTEEELDFIVNYDIKYRMGKELDDGE